MGPDLWMQGTVFALVCTQLVVFWYLYRRSEFPAIAGSATTDRPADSTDSARDGEVACPDCGTANAPEFRFCQHCVTELPGRADRPGTTDTPSGRGLS